MIRMKNWLLVLSMMLVLSMAAGAFAQSEFAGGSGTAEDPWQVTTAEQLDLMHNDLTAHYILTEDIDLSGYESWDPIGSFQPLSD